MDFIQGERFITIADYIYTPKQRHRDDYMNLPNTFYCKQLKPISIVYTHTMYVKQLFEKIAMCVERFVVITHNSDINIDDTFILPDNVIKWFTQNVNVNHPRIESIPIGLENGRWFKNLRKREKMETLLGKERKCKNLAYLNINIKTNPNERQTLYDLFGTKKWVTVEYGVNGSGFDNYIDNIYTHAFIFCPNGNGIDTHRLWETLYMGSIPIVKRGNNSRFYEELPICFVDDWNFDRMFLLMFGFDVFSKLVKEQKMLTFEYWKNKILSSVL